MDGLTKCKAECLVKTVDGGFEWLNNDSGSFELSSQGGRGFKLLNVVVADLNGNNDFIPHSRSSSY